MAHFLLSHMTQFYLSEFTIEGEHDHDRIQLSPFPTADPASSFPFPIIFNNSQDHPSRQQQLKPIEFMLLGEPSTDSALNSNFDSDPTLNSNTNISEQSLDDHCTKEGKSQISDKWMSSKMRIMRKMMINSDQTVAEAASNLETKNQDQPRQHNPENSSSSNNSGGIIRVCSDCMTTKTPLWRSGPRGPKSLCNACGIRQRKARRAIAAAAGILVATEKPTKKRSKEKGVDVDRTVPFKKRCRMISAATSRTAKKKFRFDDFSIRLSKNSALHRVFPQDERDAAILLMALSCGYIRS